MEATFYDMTMVGSELPEICKQYGISEECKNEKFEGIIQTSQVCLTKPYGQSSSQGLESNPQKLPSITEASNVDKDGDTPLHLAIKMNDPKAVNIVNLCSITTINHQDNYGQTPLHTAIYEGQNPVMEKLVKIASIDKSNIYTKTIFHIIAEKDNKDALIEVVKVYRKTDELKEHLRKVLDRRDNKGKHPFTVALESKSYNVAMYMIQNKELLGISEVINKKELRMIYQERSQKPENEWFFSFIAKEYKLNRKRNSTSTSTSPTKRNVSPNGNITFR